MKQIELTQGKVALVSDEDFERLNVHNWYASLESRGTKYYAVRWSTKSDPMYPGRSKGKRYKVRMHHAVKGVYPWQTPRNRVLHHRDDDSLNNQDSNLEWVTELVNIRASKFWTKTKRSLRAV